MDERMDLARLGVNLPAQLLKDTKLLALQRDTTLSAIVRDFLEKEVTQNLKKGA